MASEVDVDAEPRSPVTPAVVRIVPIVAPSIIGMTVVVRIVSSTVVPPAVPSTAMIPTAVPPVVPSAIIAPTPTPVHFVYCRG